MEPISASASVISVAQAAQKILSNAHLSRNSIIPRLRNIGTFTTCIQLLSHLSKLLPNQTRELPESAQATLKLCFDNAQEIKVILDEYQQRSTLGKLAASGLRVALRKPELEAIPIEIEHRIQDFIEQIQAFIVIVNLDISLHISQEVNNMRRPLVHLQTTQLDTMRILDDSMRAMRIELNDAMQALANSRMNTPSDTISSTGGYMRAQDQSQHELLRHVADQVNADLEMYQASRVRRDYSFTATVIYKGNESCDNIVVQGIMDSGSPADWISRQVVERASMTAQVKPIEVELVYTGFEGGSFQPSGKIQLTWFSINKAKSKRTEFLIHDTGPFDMVLGAPSIELETVQMFKEPALVLRHANLSKVELNELERKANKKKDGQRDIAAIRKAKDATARERKRQEKAASRAMTPMPSLSRHISILSQVSSPLHLGSSNLRRQLSTLSIQTDVTEAASSATARNTPSPSVDVVNSEEARLQQQLTAIY